MIFSIIYLWPIKLPIGSVDISVYVIILIAAALIVGPGRDDFRFLGISLIALPLVTLLQAAQSVTFENPIRSFFGIIALSFTLFSIKVVFRQAHHNTLLVFYQPVRYGVYFVLVSQAIEYILWYFGSYRPNYFHYFLDIPRATGIFAEPSHLAVALSPALYLTFMDTNLSTLKHKVILLAVCLIAPSTTLIVIVILLGILKLFQRTANSGQRLGRMLAIIKISILLIVAVFSISIIEEVNERVSGIFLNLNKEVEVTAKTNVSSALFLKGYEMAKLSLTDFPLGVGALNMEFLSSKTKVSGVNEFLYQSNKNDGTSLLFKIISEFGYVGVLFCIIAMVILYRRSGSSVSSYDLATSAFLFGLLAAFVRGTSYFDGVPIIAMLIVLTWKNPSPRDLSMVKAKKWSP